MSSLLDFSVLAPEMSRDQPRLLAALDMASSAVAKVSSSTASFYRHWSAGQGVDRPRSSSALPLLLLGPQEESGQQQEALEVYQQCLGELLLALAGTQTWGDVWFITHTQPKGFFRLSPRKWPGGQDGGTYGPLPRGSCPPAVPLLLLPAAHRCRL